MLVLRGAFRPRKEAAVIGVKRNLVTTPAKPGSYQPLVARRSITGIVMSSNLKEAEKTVKDHYRNAYRGDFTVNGWKIKEIELSDDGCAEIYYGG